MACPGPTDRLLDNHMPRSKCLFNDWMSFGVTLIVALVLGACADSEATHNMALDGKNGVQPQSSELELSEVEAVSGGRMSDWLNADIKTLQQAMSMGTLTAVDLTQFYLDRIHRYDQVGPAINAIQTLNSNALSQAQSLDEERRTKGARSFLHGVPVLVKDNYETKGMVTSAGSILFAKHQPDRDATLVARLKDAGAIILGKTTMHEFAYGITTQGSRFGATKNPHNLERNPGGSSGGTGAAVAAGFAAVGMGSDTCGSIRIPAAQNSLVGLRGTQGLSSRHGIIPLSSSQDIGGPLAGTVQDLAIVLDATVGYDHEDAQTEVARDNIPASYLDQITTLKEMRIGLLTDWLVQVPEDEAVASVVVEGLQQLAQELNWQVLETFSPQVNSAVQRPLNGHYVLIADFKMDIDAYLAANPDIGLADLDALIARAQHHPSVQASLLASASMAGEKDAAYLEEYAQREQVRQALMSLMKQHDLDALAYPTIRQIAALIGEEQDGTNCRLAANSGLPAISVPIGMVDGVPVGVEFLSESFSESKLLNLAYSVEQTVSAHQHPRHTP